MKQLSLFLLLLLLCACRGGAADRTSHNSPRVVKSTIATAANYIDKDFVGMAAPDNAVNLAFKVSGQILDIPISTGQSVAKGALLAEIDPRDFSLMVAADKSAFEQAKSRLDRAERLLERQAVSRQEYEEALSSYVRASSTYENSQEVLAQTVLRAPFAAVIEKVFVDNFERVQSGQSILRIVEPLTKYVQFTIPESSLAALQQPSTQFAVVFDNYPKVEFAATLTEYAVTTSDAAGFPVKLAIENPSKELYPIAPGFSCTVTLKIKDPHQGAISLPLSAIYAPPTGGSYVWVVDSADHVKLHRVELGELYSINRVIVESGVESGDRVVVAGVYKLREGDKVKIIQ